MTPSLHKKNLSPFDLLNMLEKMLEILPEDTTELTWTQGVYSIYISSNEENDYFIVSVSASHRFGSVFESWRFAGAADSIKLAVRKLNSALVSEVTQRNAIG